ncbi:hypothetical protein GC102_31990 [Paenibacillus sp. LMG 31460]|uniref:Uncharacterized protein n=1 Tax=Paenibacillus germinis TaxID=2654979 RepID=A0ABX1ZAG7_9BACL|nr:hypothetical protein [Paenibacillus germinis]NOU90326.1 hypothetical protein [Paenibacillus germinis]
MLRITSALKVGVIATAVMEIFFRITDSLFSHGVNFAWLNGTSFGLDSQSFSTLIVGYAEILFGGVVFAYLYDRFVPRKNMWTGIGFSVLFAMIIVAGLIMMPIMGATHPLVIVGMIPNPGLFGIGFGIKAGLFNFLGHVIYGIVLGSARQLRLDAREERPGVEHNLN